MNKSARFLRSTCCSGLLVALCSFATGIVFAHQSSGPSEVTRTRRVITAPADVAAAPPDAQVMASGLAMKVLQPGTGSEHPVANDCVTVSFIAWKTDGSLFSTSTTMNDADVLCL